MKAKEMFKKLNYSYHEYSNVILCVGNNSMTQSLCFYLDDKTLGIMINNASIPLLKAIHQQMIELGWI